MVTVTQFSVECQRRLERGARRRVLTTVKLMSAKAIQGDGNDLPVPDCLASANASSA